MQLFDDIVRDDSPAKNAERLYPFLNRSSWRVCERARSLCEDWFSRYPADDRRDMLHRFTSRKDEDHRSAYFELLLHELLSRLGGHIAVHPTVPGTSKKPDFLVELEGTRFYLEAMVNNSKEDNFDDSPIFDEVCDWINSIHIPSHFVHILFSDVPTNTPSKSGIVAQVKRLIQVGNGEITQRKLVDNGYHALASGLLELDDAYARVRLYPSSDTEHTPKEHRNVIRSSGGIAQSIVPRWRESIRLKAKYKHIEHYDAPCIIAIDMMDGFATIRNEGAQAVYGLLDDSARQGGLWRGTKGGSWRDNLAAVWMFNFAEPVQASPSGVEDCMLLKPSLEQRLPTRLTQLTHIKPEDGALKLFDGLVLDELLQVPEIPSEELRCSSFLSRRPPNNRPTNSSTC